MKTSIRRHTKKIGPGGIKCACCTFATPPKMKKAISRADRRSTRQQILKEIR